MLAAGSMASASLRSRPFIAVAALLITAALPWKEVAFAAALLLLFALPLQWQQIKLVLIRCWPFLAMLAVGVVVTVLDATNAFDSRAIVRISFYYLRVPLFVLLGFAARRYLTDDRPILWTVVALGIWGAGQTLVRYVSGSDLSGLDHNEVRAVVGSGDTISMLIPLCMMTLWPRTPSIILKAILVGASGLAVLGVVAASSRTGLVVLLLTGLFSLPRARPLPIARWGAVAVLLATFILTTPVFPPILHFFGIDPLQLDGLAEVIARPRNDLASINQQWRGYETYMAFVAAGGDGIGPFLFGHGMSAYAPLGIFIELAPGQLFDRTDIFHNGWSFIVLHSGLLGAALYTTFFYVLASPPPVSHGLELRRDNRLFALILLSLATSTAVVAGAFNAGTFATVHLFLLGCFYPYSLVVAPRVVRTTEAAGPRPALSLQG
jgi:hypothetical protein